MGDDLFTSARASSWVEITSTGVVTWSFINTVKVGCKLDSFLFPLEVQECSISIISSLYNVNKMIFFKASQMMITDSWPERSDPASWCLYASRISQFVTQSHAQQDHAGVRISLIIERPTGHHIIETVIPVAILSLLILVQFALPPSSQERITISGHILIASVLLMLLIWMVSPVSASKTTLHGKSLSL